MEKLNSVYAVGTLKEVVTRKDTNKKGDEFIAGEFIVAVAENEELEFKFYANRLTKDGKESKKYKNYEDLENLINKRVRVNGEISGRVFYKASDGQMIHFNELNAGFVNAARDSDNNTATFEYSGYVYKPLHERLNEKEEVIGYEIEIAQANWNETNMQIVKFNVPKNRQDMINAIRNSYTRGSTVLIQGEIHYVIEHVSKTETMAFGEPIVKEFTNTRKVFLITGGKEPIVNDLAYTREQIETLEKAYAEYLSEVEKQAKSDNSAGKAVTNKAPAKDSKVNRLLF